MKSMAFSTLLTDNTDALVGSTASIGTTLSLASVSPIDPSDPWSFLSYIPAIIGPALLVIVNRHLSAKAARKLARAKFLRDEADEIETDADSKNDAVGREKRLEAAELEAEAEALRHPR